MKNHIKSKIILIFMLLFSMLVHAEFKVATVDAGIIDDINTRKSTVTINGKVFTYKPNVNSSLFSIDERDHQTVDLRALKKGDTYYFEKTSNKEDPSANDFNEIIFISEKPLSENE